MENVPSIMQGVESLLSIPQEDVVNPPIINQEGMEKCLSITLGSVENLTSIYQEVVENHPSITQEGAKNHE